MKERFLCYIGIYQPDSVIKDPIKARYEQKKAGYWRDIVVDKGEINAKHRRDIRNIYERYKGDMSEI